MTCVNLHGILNKLCVPCGQKKLLLVIFIKIMMVVVKSQVQIFNQEPVDLLILNSVHFLDVI